MLVCNFCPAEWIASGAACMTSSGSTDARAVFHGRERRDPVYPLVSAGHILFLLTMLVVIMPLAFALDPLAAAMRGHWPEPLRATALATTGFGEEQWVLVPAGLFLLSAWLIHRRNAGVWLSTRQMKVAAYLFATTGSAELLSGLLKGLFGRPRPFMIASEGAFTLNPGSVEAAFLSFPSGHATAMAASCMAVGLLWPTVRGLMLPLALWLGFTRIVSGAHHPSDVIVGLVLGAYLALIISFVFERQGLLAFSRSAKDASATPSEPGFAVGAALR